MKIFKPTYALKFVLLCASFAIISCSKDSDNTPEASEITVTTSSFSVTIDENPSEAQLIGTVAGTTNQGSVLFSITEQTPAGAFSIDAASGELKVANANLFDFETNPTILGTVKVTNGAVFENASVTISVSDIYEENIFNGNVELTSQQEVIDFGLNNYTHIVGYLTIGHLNLTGTATDLSPLNSLRDVSGQFRVFNNTQLTNLNGLDNLSHVGESIEIVNNTLLESIEALHNLPSVNQHLNIIYNPSLSSLHGLHNVATADLLVIIRDNSSLLNLDGLSSLNTILQYGIIIENNGALQNIDGLSNLTYSDGDVWIINNDSLTSIQGLQNFTYILNNLNISDNELLTNLDGLENIYAIGWHLYVENNTSLTNLCALQNVLNNDGLGLSYNVTSNAYNPTQQDIIDGNCSI